MGVVIKQSFWGTFISYLGVMIAYINSLYLRPEFLKIEEIGLFTLITAHAMMVSPMSTLGMQSSFIKFFPSFEERDRQRFFSFSLLVVICGNILIILIGYLFKDLLASRYQDTAPEYIDYLSITAIIMVSNSFFEFFFNYSRTIMRVIFPSFLREIFLRVGAISVVVGFALKWLSFSAAITGLGVTYMLACAFLFLQLTFKHSFRFDFNFKPITGEFRKKLFRFASYSMLVAGSFAIINNTTYDQITAQLGTAANGIFATCFFIGVIVEMPRRNMAKVISPILSAAFEKSDLKTISNIYKRSSITMSAVGVLIFIGIITNIQDLFTFIPKGDVFEKGFWVVIAVCIAKLLTMISSFPGEIINFSRHYEYNLYFQLLSLVILIVSNYFLITKLGLNGAAIGYLTAIGIHVLLKVAFVYRQFNIHPFLKEHSKLLLITILVGVLAYAYDTSLHPIADIAIRSIFTSVLFVTAIVYFKVSSDINNLALAAWDQVKKIVRKG